MNATIWMVMILKPTFCVYSFNFISGQRVCSLTKPDGVAPARLTPLREHLPPPAAARPLGQKIIKQKVYKCARYHRADQCVGDRRHDVDGRLLPEQAMQSEINQIVQQ